MKRLAFLLPVLAVLPLAAQDWEAGVFLGKQDYKAPSGSFAGDMVAYTPENNRPVTGLRLGHALVDLGPVLFQVTAGYQFKTTTKVTSSLDNNYQGNLANTSDFKSSSYSVGAMFNLHALVSVGAGVEYRFETYQYAGQTTNASRPWGRVNLGFDLPLPEIKPFAGLEVDYPLTSTTLAFPPSGDNVPKALAPKGQVGLYAGLRF